MSTTADEASTNGSASSANGSDEILQNVIKRARRAALKQLLRFEKRRASKKVLKAFMRWKVLSEIPAPVAVITTNSPVTSTEDCADAGFYSPPYLPPRSTLCIPRALSEYLSSGGKRFASKSPPREPAFVDLPRKQPTPTSLGIGPTRVPLSRNLSAFGLAQLLTGRASAPVLAAMTGLGILGSPPGHLHRKAAASVEDHAAHAYGRHDTPSAAAGWGPSRGRLAPRDASMRIERHTSAQGEESNDTQTQANVLDDSNMSANAPMEHDRTKLLRHIKARMRESSGKSPITPPKPARDTEETAAQPDDRSALLNMIKARAAVKATDESTVQPDRSALLSMIKAKAAKADGEPASATAAAADDKYNKYRKMLAVGVPAPAVGAKMVADGISPDEMTPSRLNKPAAASQPSSTPAPVELPEHLKKYAKMLSVGVPIEAVRAKMRSEGLTETPSKLTAPPAQSTPKKEIDPTLVKFKKMLAVGVPKDAVRAKMRSEGVNASPSQLLSPPMKNGSPNTAAVPTPAAADPRLAPFKRMLSVGVPAPAVAAKMRQAGMDDAAIAAVVGNKSPAAGMMRGTPIGKTRLGSPLGREDGTPAAANPTPSKLPPRKLYWKEAPAAKASFWSSLYADPSKLRLPSHVHLELTSLFEAQPAPAGGNGGKRDPSAAGNRGSGTPTAAAPDVITVLDSRRSGNVSIILSRFSSVSFDMLRTCVDTLSVPAGSEDAVRGLLTLMPSSAERDAFKKVVEDMFPGKTVQTLAKADIDVITKKLPRPDEWLFKCMATPRFTSRGKCLALLLDLPSIVVGVEEKAVVLADALRQLKSSPTFQDLLRLALLIGNKLNGADDPSQHVWMAAFSLDSLSKLSTVKAADKRTTALACVVDAWYRARTVNDENGDDDLSRELKKECYSVPKCLNVVLEVLEADIKMMRAAVKAIGAEVAHVRACLDAPHDETDTPTLTSTALAFEKLEMDVGSSLAKLEGMTAGCKAELTSLLEHYGCDATVYPTPEALIKDMNAFLVEVFAADAELKQRKARKNREASNSRERGAGAARSVSVPPPVARPPLMMATNAVMNK